MKKCRETFAKAVETLVELASLQASRRCGQTGLPGQFTARVLTRSLSLLADGVRDSGRGDQDDQPPRQRPRARRHPPPREHNFLHQLRVSRPLAPATPSATR